MNSRIPRAPVVPVVPVVRTPRALAGIAVLAAALVASIAGCADSQAARDRAQPQAHYVNNEYNVRVSFPVRVKASYRFDSDYLLPDRWNPDAGERVPGEGLLTLTLPESSHLLTARLRLGVSDDSSALPNCALPSAARTGAVSKVTIGGVVFQEVDSGDAAMSHFLSRHSYRGVAHGNCYAIDLAVSGVNPSVYPGNPKPPMSQKDAFAQLTALLAGFDFSS